MVWRGACLGGETEEHYKKEILERRGLGRTGGAKKRIGNVFVLKGIRFAEDQRKNGTHKQAKVTGHRGGRGYGMWREEGGLCILHFTLSCGTGGFPTLACKSTRRSTLK